MPDGRPVRPVYLFNSVDGGPRQGPPNRAWTGDELARLSEVYDLAFKLETARPLPQIYNFLYAKEWYQVRQYVRINRRRPLKTISGVMTECGDAGCSFPFSTSAWTSYQTCSDPVPDLRPESGWRAMYATLHYTLIQDLNVNAPILMTADLRITLASDRTYDPCELISKTLTNGSQRTLSSGSLFPAGTTFPYDLLLPGAVFNTHTQQSLSWSTDITSDIVAPRRTQ